MAQYSLFYLTDQPTPDDDPVPPGSSGEDGSGK